MSYSLSKSVRYIWLADVPVMTYRRNTPLFYEYVNSVIPTSFVTTVMDRSCIFFSYYCSFFLSFIYQLFYHSPISLQSRDRTWPRLQCGIVAGDRFARRSNALSAIEAGDNCALDGLSNLIQRYGKWKKKNGFCRISGKRNPTVRATHNQSFWKKQVSRSCLHTDNERIWKKISLIRD